MAKGISVTWSEGVSEEESNTLLATIEQTFQWLYFRWPSSLYDPPFMVRVFGNWVIPALVDSHPYWGMQWYVDSSYDRGLDRVIAPVYLELVRREPWQQADHHLDLALLDEDLTEYPAPLARLRPQDYALGTSLPGTVAIMSVYRLRRLSSREIRSQALARLARHHLGHVLSIPPFERKDRVVRRGLELHCDDRCVMRHAETVEQLAAYAAEEAEMGWPFCPLCTQGLQSAIVRHSQEWS